MPSLSPMNTSKEVESVPPSSPNGPLSNDTVNTDSKQTNCNEEMDQNMTESTEGDILEPMNHTSTANSGTSVPSDPKETDALPILEFRERLPIVSEQNKIYGAEHEDSTGTKWRLMWFPNGNDTMGSHCSLYMEMIVDSSTPFDVSKEVEFVLGAMNHKDPFQSLEKSVEMHEFTRQATDWGFKSFMSISEMTTPENGFIINNNFIEIIAKIQYLRQGTFWGSSAYGDYDSKAETGMVGLKNQGATCYMNSLLQTLFHLPKFRQAVYDTPTENDDTTDSVSLALQRVFYRLQTYDTAVSTKELTKSFGWGHLDSFTQHDVQELYRILCDRLEEKMKSTNVDGTIKYLFEGQVRSFIKCVNVDFTSFRDESFYDVQLDVKGCQNLYASFKKYIEVEMLNEDNQYEAEGYGKQDAEKGLRFRQFPPVLNIHLKRFEYDPMRDGMVKVNDRFEFPEKLSLDYVLDPDMDPSKDKNMYHLHSVLVHSGDVHGGHYYVFIRPSSNIASKDWFKFDDDRITKVSTEVAINGNFGGIEEDNENCRNLFGKRLRPSGVNFSSAYMLVYVREKEHSEIMMEMTEKEIPESLVTRFQHEEEQAIRRRKEQQEEHLYMIVRVVTDTTIANFQRVTKSNDFATFSEATKFRVRRQQPVCDIYELVYKRLGVPIHRQHFWQIITRENKTIRPDSPLEEKHASMPMSSLYEEYRGKGGLYLYLQVLPENSSISKSLENYRNGEIEKENQIAKIHCYLEDEFIPPKEEESMSPTNNAQNENTKDVTSDIMDNNLSISDELRSKLRFPIVGDTDILLFIKLYDPTLPLGQRLSYVGHILIDAASTGGMLLSAIRKHLKFDFEHFTTLYEEIQPMMIQEINLFTSLQHAELQHGDIVICQLDVGDSGKKIDSNGNHTTTNTISRKLSTSNTIRYPIVAEYFSYLLDRCDVTFSSIENPEEDGFALPLLLRNSYEEVIQAVANHLKLDDPLYIRLYQHSTVSGRPKQVPLSHKANCNGVTTLEDMLCDYSERTTTLYYEKLEFPITEIEAKKLVVVAKSLYNIISLKEYEKNEQDKEKNTEDEKMEMDGYKLLSEEMERSSVLLSFDQTVEDLIKILKEDMGLEKRNDIEFRLFELSPTRCTIERYFAGTEPITELPPSTNHWDCNLLLEVVPKEERIVLHDKNNTDYRMITITHFQQSHPTASGWVQEHGVPLMTFVLSNETFEDLRKRIQKRMSIPSDILNKWRLSMFSTIPQNRLEDQPGELNTEIVFQCDRFLDPKYHSGYDYVYMGLEYPDPKPTPSRYGRQEQGIKIRQN